MALKDLGINYKRTMREDNMMEDIGFCIKENRHKKIHRSVHYWI